MWPTREPDWNLQSKREERLHAFGKFPLAFPTAPATFRHLPVIADFERLHQNIPSCALLFRNRHIRLILPASRRSPDPHCSSTSAWLLLATSLYSSGFFRAARLFFS